MSALIRLKTAIRLEDINSTIIKNYSLISKEYTTFLSEWLTNSNKIFKDSEKFNILIYIFYKNLEFYHKNLINFDYKTFEKTNLFDIQKINIIEISKNLNIPKETARRKIISLEKDGVIKRKKKQILIDKNNFVLFDITNTLKSITVVLFKIYGICFKEKKFVKNILRDDIYKTLENKFSFAMLHFFEFIIPWTNRWKIFFDNDLESFIIWSVIVLNKSVKIVKTHDENLNISNWRAEIEHQNTLGINKMSLAEITGIPRPTVTRKINKLLNKKLVKIDKYKLIHPDTSNYRKELNNIHNTSIASFSKFALIVINLILIY